MSPDREVTSMANLENLLTVPEFARRFPNIASSEQAVRWLLRNRHANGLIDSGAVIELWAKPGQSRPTILLDPEQMIPWMLRANPRASHAAHP
jgi:hypothetical protein